LQEKSLQEKLPRGQIRDQYPILNHWLTGYMSSTAMV
jgi:hypothetical protein